MSVQYHLQIARRNYKTSEVSIAININNALHLITLQELPRPLPLIFHLYEFFAQLDRFSCDFPFLDSLLSLSSKDDAYIFIILLLSPTNYSADVYSILC